MVCVAVGIVVRDNRVLICQRRKNSRYGLKWEFPGGKIKPRETPEECLVRELQEELNIKAKTDSLFWRERHTYPDGASFEIFFFLITEFSGTMKNRAFEDIRWVERSRLHEFDTLEGNAQIIKLLAEDTHWKE